MIRSGMSVRPGYSVAYDGATGDGSEVKADTSFDHTVEFGIKVGGEDQTVELYRDAVAALVGQLQSWLDRTAPRAKT